ncbi:MAG: ACP S-malonyltransferase [Clostridia bacterium]|nr:ACP S-malonyltransferase [Clostridia bacterium]
MLAYVFPGQGSQQKGMGAELFDEFKELIFKTDKVLGYSIEELCLEDPEMKLAKTQHTQPALYVVNALTYYKKIKEMGRTPDYVAGHSLGEYNALLAAGVFDFETGLRIVKYRGELMSQASGGGMAAVIGMDGEKVKQTLGKNGFYNIDVANFNSPSQIVISGLKEDIEGAQAAFLEAGAKNYVILKVSGAFHSRYMEAARLQFETFINQFEFSPPSLPVISNVDGRIYKKSNIKSNMAKQITGSVMWTDTIRYLMGKGEVEIVQIGPGTVLTGLIRSIQREAAPIIVNEDTEGEDDLAQTKGKTDEKTLQVTGGAPKEQAGTPFMVTGERAVREQEQSVSDGKMGYRMFKPESLGSDAFKKDYNLKYAYLAGGMYKGIASKEMVVAMGKAGMMGFLGTGGLNLSQIEESIRYIQKELNHGQAYGINFLHNPMDARLEEKTVNVLLSYGVRNIEAAAFLSITPALVIYRVKGLQCDSSGKAIAFNKVIAKVSRPEVAEAFLSPAPDWILSKLLDENKITREEAQWAKKIPMADDICAEADSAGHTDGAVAYALIPAMMKLRDEIMEKYQYDKKIRVGAAGGIGTPEAAAAAFVLGVDFILTGSINQCTVEAATSNPVKDLLQQMNVQDTEYAPAGDMFELGAKVQVLKKGLFFSARANKLYDLYRQFNSLDEIDERTRTQIQEKYFKKSFEEVYRDIQSYYPPEEIERAERNSKYKMALIFKWYFGYSTRLALDGNETCKVDFQIHCGPALGAFNQWVKGSELEGWRNRHVDAIGEKIMKEAANYLNQRFEKMSV